MLVLDIQKDVLYHNPYLANSHGPVSIFDHSYGKAETAGVETDTQQRVVNRDKSADSGTESVQLNRK